MENNCFGQGMIFVLPEKYDKIETEINFCKPVGGKGFRKEQTHEIRILYPSERITVFISIRRILSGNGGTIRTVLL